MESKMFYEKGIICLPDLDQCEWLIASNCGIYHQYGLAGGLGNARHGVNKGWACISG